MTRRPENIEILSNTMRRVRTFYDRRAACHGLTLARVRVLSRLHDQEGLTQIELAQLLQIEAPTLSRQIDALVADGFVERRARPEGGRARALYLTEFAKTHSITEFIRQARHIIFAGISDEDLRIFQTVLRQIDQNIDLLEQE